MEGERQPPERDIDDAALLAEQARALVEKQAAEIRAAKLPIETAPPTVYRA